MRVLNWWVATPRWVSELLQLHEDKKNRKLLGPETPPVGNHCAAIFSRPPEGSVLPLNRTALTITLLITVSHNVGLIGFI